MSEYIVVHAGSMRALAERVNERLKEGYHPQGGMVACEQGFAQAMAK